MLLDTTDLDSLSPKRVNLRNFFLRWNIKNIVGYFRSHLVYNIFIFLVFTHSILFVTFKFVFESWIFLVVCGVFYQVSEASTVKYRLRHAEECNIKDDFYIVFGNIPFNIAMITNLYTQYFSSEVSSIQVVNFQTKRNSRHLFFISRK